MTDLTTFDRRLHLEPALSWSAIIAGALAALAISAALSLLASGFGYDLAVGALASHHALDGFTPAIGAGAIAIQVISAGLGGYLAGRLRHTWLSAHADEAHFRDTAHGLLAWALFTVAGLVLTSLVLSPYAQGLLPAAAAQAPLTSDAAARAAHILSQSAFFAAVGMFLSAFTAAVAARLGGMRSEEMHLLARA